MVRPARSRVTDYRTAARVLLEVTPTRGDIMPNDAHTAESGQASKLNRRRDKVQSAKTATEAAQRRLDGLDDQLAADAAQAQQHEAALRRASDEVARRKKALKASAKTHQRLAASRKKAAAALAKAQQKAQTAETKYDEAVLATMVRRERDRDLAAHQQPTGTTAAVNAAPERPAIASQTATDTAARKTADAAEDPTEPGSGTPR
jgi:chromosome segregation ATPase